MRNGTIYIDRLEPRSYVPGLAQGANATAGAWGPYAPAGAMGYLWARTNVSGGSSSSSGDGSSSWYPVCFRGDEPGLQVAYVMFAAVACETAGYTLGYRLPPSYASYGMAAAAWQGRQQGAGQEGQEQQQQQPQLFVSNVGCIISSGPEGTSTECEAELGPECVGAPAVLSCIPNATASGSILDLDLVVDWQAPQAAAATAGGGGGTAPTYAGDNVLYGENYERYIWPAGSTPYATAYHVCVKKFAVVDPPVALRFELAVRRAGAVVLSQSITWSYWSYADGSPQELLISQFEAWGGGGGGGDGSEPTSPPSPPPPGPGSGGACGPGSRGYLGSYNYTGSSGSNSSSGGGAGSGAGGAPPPPELEIVVAWSAVDTPRMPIQIATGGTVLPPAAAAVGTNVTVRSLMPRSYVEATRAWPLYRPAGALGFMWGSAGDPATLPDYYLPICTPRGEPVEDFFAAMACWNDPAKPEGYVLGYGLPPWYLPHTPSLTGVLGPQPPRFLTQLRCGSSAGSCTAIVSDTCEDFALLSCIPKSSDYLVLLDLDLLVDWAPPPSAAAALLGTAPTFLGDNVATGLDYERYVWPADLSSDPRSRPYRTEYYVCVDNFRVVDPPGPVRIDLAIRSGGVVVLEKSVVWDSGALSGGGFFASFGDPPANPPAPGRGAACNASTRGFLAAFHYTGRTAAGSYSTTRTAGSRDALPPELEIVVGWSWAGGSNGTGSTIPTGTAVVSNFVLPWQYQYPNRNWAYYRNPGSLAFTLATVRGSGLRYPVCAGSDVKQVTLLAALTCAAAGYVFGYALPAWYVPRPHLDTSSLGYSAPRFVTGLSCNTTLPALLLAAGQPPPPYECSGTLSDTCESGYALVSCVPNSTVSTNAIFDLDAVVDWPPPKPGVAGSGPVLCADNVAITANYERYLWRAGSTPYATEYAVCVDNARAVLPGGPMRVDLTVRSRGVTVLQRAVTFPNTSEVGGRLLDVLPAAGQGLACNSSSRGYLGSYNYTGRSGSNSGSGGGAGSGAGGAAPDSHDAAPPELEIVVAWAWAGGPPPPSPSPAGGPQQPNGAQQNLARGAAAYSSSYLSWWCLGGCRAAYAIDGDTATDKQMLHTAAADFDAWLALDLGAPSIISAVRIWHRAGYLDRTQLSELRIGNASVLAAAAGDAAAKLLQRNTLVWKQAARLTDNVTELVFQPPVVGRWVTFQNLVPSPRMDDEHVLQVRELEVFGLRLPATPARLYQDAHTGCISQALLSSGPSPASLLAIYRNNTAATPDLCAQAARRLGARYYAVQGGDCWRVSGLGAVSGGFGASALNGTSLVNGTSLTIITHDTDLSISGGVLVDRTPGGSRPDPTDQLAPTCDAPCPGEAKQTCGGDRAVDMYEIALPAASPPPAPRATAPPPPGSADTRECCACPTPWPPSPSLPPPRSERTGNPAPRKLPTSAPRSSHRPPPRGRVVQGKRPTSAGAAP
ncbi:hypothetical protein HXX76_009696 [Chlamydomonas incerta]|uniref:Uncharacterized protein n=1 Tax=Chlamydomonas incerta TaxID=51695 RepID=A0A835SPY3_CHLIN|nr:hypothetical protein HXX76_009696 [Chlamydomonas incerta]|eukprot:KAG2431167.1 hypothetical protein HXX76_009696 [Chlamydomonas incerta]